MEEQNDGSRVSRDRAVMALLGGVAGVAAWVFFDLLPDRVEDQRWLLFSAALVMGSFVVLLALSGPLRLGRALSGALSLAVPAAVLLLWASFRFSEIEAFLQGIHAIVAYGVILFIGAPYVAAALQSPGGWREYARLFDIAWAIVVRYAAGWLFVGLFWAVLMLSDQLLQLVGIELIERVLRIDPVPYVLSGLVLGLALSVIHEMREYVSPYLIHRLLRLLLPMLLPVVALFILALPLRGLDGLFGRLSAAATLMAVALAGITLISTALDRSDEDAAEAPLMLWSARVFSLFVPVLSGLAIYAVWLRVGQYGWTPSRLLAGLAAGFLLAYGLAYTVSVLRGGALWRQRIRSANLGMALVLVGVSMLWLTPLVNAERISARSQLARAHVDISRPEVMALWELAHEWGHAGEEALAALEADARAAGADPLLTAIDQAREARSRFGFKRQMGEGDISEQRAELENLMQLRPPGVTLPEGAFDGLSRHFVNRWLAGCRIRLGDGRPGCALVFGPFRPGLAAQNGYVFLNTRGGGLQVSGVVLNNGKIELHGSAQEADGLLRARRARTALTREHLAALLDGDFEIVPVELNALRVGDQRIIPDN